MKILDGKNFKLTGNGENPSNIDYDIMGLHKKRTIIKGELKQIEYYREYDYTGNTYNDLVLTEYRTYIRNPINIVLYRNQKTDWFYEDGTTGYTKDTVKYYSPEEAIQEGVDRRTNMIGFAKTKLLDGLKAIHGEPANQTYAFDLLTSVKTELDYFTQGYTQPLRDAISGSTKPYLTEQIKIDIISELTL